MRGDAVPRRRAAALYGLSLLLPATLAGQALPRFEPPVHSPAALFGDSGLAAPGVDWRSLGQKPWVRPLASLLVPGAGQLIGGQPRGVIYLALEAWLISRAIAFDRRGDEQSARYRQLAFDVARRPFGQVRVDGPFEYYETMEKFVESGAFDADPGPAFMPEGDSTTFNGSVWDLARRTFFANPDSLPDPASAPYQAALAFYQARAVGGQFRWSWRGARLEQDVFRDAIRSSDDAFRSRTNFLGALVLNHLASAIDALISVRNGRRRAAIPQLEFRSDPDGMSLVWTGRF